MARGGARPGSGRKKGSVNKLSSELAKAAAATGKLAHEILLALGRGEKVPGFKKQPDNVRIDCLKAAAPFYAPKLMAAAVKMNPGDWNPYHELMESVKSSRGLPAKPRSAAR